MHLAALQVPFCRADPVLGARVNVVGTVNVFEAVKERLDRIPGVAYASSAAVYGPDDPSPAPESGGIAPGTIYGVYKLANEGTARLYQAESGVPSIGIRPYVVYGPGRDQGMTVGPDASDGRGRPRRGLRDRLRRRRPVRLRAGRRPRLRPCSLGAGGRGRRELPRRRSASMAEVVAAIEAAAPEVAGQITWDETPLPFPAEVETHALEEAIGPLPQPSLAEGIAETIELFRRT